MNGKLAASTTTIIIIRRRRASLLLAFHAQHRQEHEPQSRNSIDGRPIFEPVLLSTTAERRSSLLPQLPRTRQVACSQRNLWSTLLRTWLLLAAGMFSANEIVAPAQRLSGPMLKRGPKQGSKWQTRFVELYDREVSTRIGKVFAVC